MGHDAVMSPAHRRNQNPMSPSASLFRKTSSFSKDDVDLSWTALLRRHRFLLSMLSLLAFLCTVYLYFAIKLGADNCAGMIGKDLTQCQLKRTKSKSFHGHRKLLSRDDFIFGYRTQNSVRNSEDALLLMDKLSHDNHISTVMTVGCVGSDLIKFLEKQFTVFKFASSCDEDKEMLQSKENVIGHPLDLTTMGTEHSYPRVDVIICNKCDKLSLPYADGKSGLQAVSEILRPGGHFIHFPDASSDVDFLSNNRLLKW